MILSQSTAWLADMLSLEAKNKNEQAVHLLVCICGLDKSLFIVRATHLETGKRREADYDRPSLDGGCLSYRRFLSQSESLRRRE